MADHLASKYMSKSSNTLIEALQNYVELLKIENLD